MTKARAGVDQVAALAEPPDMTTPYAATDPHPHDTAPRAHAGDGARWRRLRRIVNARLFGDTPPQVGRYRLLESLGSGAMGVVFSALDTELQRTVAIKLLNGGTGDVQRRRLQREAQAMAQIAHPNVVGVYDVGESDGELYVAMELVTGVTLRGWLDATADTRSWRDTVAVFAAAARGLAAAHAGGLVHRDFKPENVLIAEDGRVCVVDFGLVARGEGVSDPLLDAQGDLPSSVGASIPTAGTPAYMAPEQVVGRPVDARADVWSFTVALYEALHGRRPFDRDTVPETLAAVVEGAVAWPRAAVPGGLVRLMRRGLQVDRDRRQLDMAAIARELHGLLAARRRRWIGLGGVVASASIAALAVRAFAGASVVCDPEAVLGAAWDGSRREAVAQRLGELGVAATPAVIAALDRHAQRWTTEYQTGCGTDSSDRERLAAGLCLEAVRDAFAATTAILADADLALVRDVDQILAGLASPHACGDAATRPPPFEESEGPEVGAWRHDLARAHALWNAGDDPQASRIAREIFDAAHAARAWAVAADAGVLVGEIAFVAMEDLGEEAVILAQGREAAGRANHVAAAVRAGALLVHAPTGDGGSALEGRFSGALGHAESIGDAESLAILAIAVATGSPRTYGLDLARADALRERAREMATARLGVGHRLTRATQGQLARWAGAPTVEVARAQLDGLERAWGPESGSAGAAHVVLAAALRAEGRIAEAIAALEAGVAILAEVHGETGLPHTVALADLSAMHFDAGELERSVAVGERLIAALRVAPPDPRWQGHTAENVALVLARALLGDGQSERAMGFVLQAVEADDLAQRWAAQTVLAELRLREGRVGEATDAIEAVWREMGSAPSASTPGAGELGRARLVRGLTMLARDELLGARAEIEAALLGFPSAAAREHVVGYTGLAAVSRRRGDTDDARLYLDRALQFVDGVPPRDPAAVAVRELAESLRLGAGPADRQPRERSRHSSRPTR